MSVDTATTLRAVTDEDAAVLSGLREHPTSPFDDFSLLIPQPNRTSCYRRRTS